MSSVWTHRIEHGVRIPMRDGTLLSADLYLPDGEGPWPLVLEYQPYRKDEVDSEKRFYTGLPEHGYVVARLDVRGTGASPGTVSDEYVEQEQQDGYDAVEWLAEQPFCDGNVNMMGISYGGFTALQVAATQPPHLRSVIPMHFTDDRYRDDCHYVGGHPRMYYDIGFYGTFMVAYNALPPDPSWAEDWAEVWQQHLEGDEPYLLTWLSNQTDGPYWRHGSVGDIAEDIRCPVFMIGGWGDGYRNAPLRLYEKLTVPARVLMGPWNHAVPDSAVPGPRIDHLHEVVRWLDHWCGREGGDAGLDPAPVVVYEQHFEPPVDADRTLQPGCWRAERSWPPAGAATTTLHLGEDGTLAADAPDPGQDTLVYDATVGTHGGLWSAGVAFGLPGDQRPDEARSAVYTTEPLTEDLHLLGRATLTLHVSTSATVIGFVANLNDVAPDGSSQLVAKGVLNATRRESLSTPQPLEPGRIYELQIEIDTTSWRFQRGHRLRIAVANADWPNMWPTPEPATSLLHCGTGHLSRLEIPTAPATPEVEAPVFRAAPDEPEPHLSLAHAPTWRVERDALSRQTWVRYHFDYAERVNAHTVVERSYDFETHVDPDDPARASAHGAHTSTIRREGTTTVAVAGTTITGSPTHFHLTTQVQVHVNGVHRAARNWTISIPRELC
ncbi:CocE/NonD family hydrolase [Nocardioides mangrovicus]|uniref:CocE/NonD family hydrolase n=1 Tax=Nocardioides mangrovicus TaxID=2478913 RepID=A0A3L8P2A1_9ACTN|nr:CocE/NonD family hydrolase [Nocardioides mangrovicus]RLV49072.1 CocE/NonD family hydrolase [Nocardioides mangrovicus]